MPTLATNSFELALPDSWRIESLKSPAKVIGPAGETLIVTSTVVSAVGSGHNVTPVKQSLQIHAEVTMQQISRDPQLRVTLPLKKEITSSGYQYSEMQCQMADNSLFFASFTIAGPTAFIFATLEGPMSTQATIGTVREAIRTITWLQKGTNPTRAIPGKKPWWKIW